MRLINAETQTLGAIRYHQVVTRKLDGQVSHNETGYYSWDPATKTVPQATADISEKY